MRPSSHKKIIIIALQFITFINLKNPFILKTVSFFFKEHVKVTLFLCFETNFKYSSSIGEASVCKMNGYTRVFLIFGKD